MRIVGYIEHPNLKITIMHMNHRYAVKFENGKMEQTYKIRESDQVSSAADVKKVVHEGLVLEVEKHFRAMESTWFQMIAGAGDEEDEFEDII